ncbi:MAG: Mll2313 protein, partial [uncultured Friedmanniella sp.]
ERRRTHPAPRQPPRPRGARRLDRPRAGRGHRQLPALPAGAGLRGHRRGLPGGVRRPRADGRDRPRRAVRDDERDQPRGAGRADDRGRGGHRPRWLARRDRGLLPELGRLPAPGRRPVRRAPGQAPGRAGRGRQRQLRALHRGADRGGPQPSGHRGPAGPVADHRAVLGADRRLRRRARDHHPGRPALGPLDPARHLARGLDPAVGAGADLRRHPRAQHGRAGPARRPRPDRARAPLGGPV